MVNACGKTQMERLQDVPNRIREITLHGVRSGAAGALAGAQLRDGAQLSETLTPDFIEECNDEDFDELAEEFAPCANAMALVSSSADIISRVFDNED
jgi:hypothetical protein